MPCPRVSGHVPWMSPANLVPWSGRSIGVVPVIDQTKDKLMNEEKLKAAGKMAFGAARIASGLATAGGKGLIGGYCRNHGLMSAAYRLAQSSVSAGTAMLEAGWAEWNAASAPAKPADEPKAAASGTPNQAA